MAYTKTTWATDDIITASGLNNIENGLDGVANVVTTTGTPHANYWTGVNVRFNVKKMGSLVIIDFEGTPNASFGAWYTFGTIPEGYRPPENQFFPIIHANTNILPMQVTSNGALQLLAALPSLSSIRFTVAYFVV